MSFIEWTSLNELQIGHRQLDKQWSQISGFLSLSEGLHWNAALRIAQHRLKVMNCFYSKLRKRKRTIINGMINGMINGTGPELGGRNIDQHVRRFQVMTHRVEPFYLPLIWSTKPQRLQDRESTLHNKIALVSQEKNFGVQSGNSSRLNTPDEREMHRQIDSEIPIRNRLSGGLS